MRDEQKRLATRAERDPNYRPWTEEEVDRLRDLAQRMNARDIAVEMGRTWRSVKRAMQYRGITSGMGHTLAGPREQERRSKISATQAAQGKTYGTQEERFAARLANQQTRLAGAVLAVFRVLGSKCVLCGNDDLLALEIDHVRGDGDGTAHRKASGRGIPYYRELLRTAQEEPGRLQLLCANCHRRKRRLAVPAWAVLDRTGRYPRHE